MFTEFMVFQKQTNLSQFLLVRKVKKKHKTLHFRPKNNFQKKKHNKIEKFWKTKVIPRNHNEIIKDKTKNTI